jgi:uncharacterized protein (TIGR04255 family)
MLDLTKIERPHDLPQWANPPLEEVALSVQFTEISGLRISHYGLLAEHFRALGLVVTEDKSPINASFEVFGKRTPPAVQFQFQAVEVPMPRVWYMSADRHHLAQVQLDRFVYNWRKVEGEGVYPRLNTVFPEFGKALELFRSFLKDNGLPDLTINQFELSYFNNIPLLEEETYDDAFARTFRAWIRGDVPNAVKSLQIESETSNFTRTYIVKPPVGDPVARIHVNAVPAMGPTGRIIRLMFIFRGPWSGPPEAGLAECMALGRESIVRLFDSMITDQMHDVWGRYVEGPS